MTFYTISPAERQHISRQKGTLSNHQKRKEFRNNAEKQEKKYLNI